MVIEQPCKTADLTLKNRITFDPMGTNFSASDGLVTERDKAYFFERTEGGIAMIMAAALGFTGQVQTHLYSCLLP